MKRSEMGWRWGISGGLLVAVGGSPRKASRRRAFLELITLGNVVLVYSVSPPRGYPG